AALKSKSGKIGVLNRADSPQSIEENTAFNDGLRAVKADILVTNVTFDSSNSKKIVSNYADVFRKSGVDLIFNNCGPMGLDVYKWAASNNIMMIGSVDDQYYLAPSIVLTSVQINYEKMLGFALEQMMRGQWQGSLYRFGMAEKVTDIAPLRGILNASQEEVFYEIYKEIASQKGEVFERI
ncbi:MAG: BMP family ABC transporter substrate-binding protein, partial [Candidatus Cloacimonadaceae bacterium]|nr:BMP family ABC transporter substrate-binding protein [Candidatus Cloacimonadaceae bacterium]